MTENPHIITICGRPEAADDVTPGRDAFPVKGYEEVNSELASSSNLGENRKQHNL